MPNKRFRLNESVVGNIKANKGQIGYVQEIIRVGRKEKYKVSWNSGRVTVVTSRAINSAPVEIPQLQENNNFGVEVDNQNDQISDNDDINNEILSEVSGRERLSEVRINLDS